MLDDGAVVTCPRHGLRHARTSRVVADMKPQGSVATSQ